MINIGLTGSVGMGKTTTAKVFEKLGCDVWDADETVHKLYSKGGKAVVEVAKLFPSSVEDGSISRSLLKALLKNEPKNLKELEEIVVNLEKGDISLDDAIKAYEKGSILKDQCEKRLNEAKLKVEAVL